MEEPDWVFEWRTTEPEEVSEWERRRGPRKFRLYVVGCYRELLPLLADDRSRAALTAAERYADGLLTAAELQTARGLAEFASYEAEADEEFTDQERLAMSVLPWVAVSDGELMDTNFNPVGYAIDRMEADRRGVRWPLWLDVYGPRERPAVAPGWLTPTVLALAAQMYESRDFSAMPILADALQDTGCDNPDVLAHCRAPGPHVRGCWVCDRLLDKA